MAWSGELRETIEMVIRVYSGQLNPNLKVGENERWLTSPTEAFAGSSLILTVASARCISSS